MMSISPIEPSESRAVRRSACLAGEAEHTEGKHAA
jgi:hypothetical protein